MTSGARRAVEHEEEEEEHMTTTTTSLALAQTFSQTCLGVVVEEVGSGVHVPAQEEEEEDARANAARRKPLLPRSNSLSRSKNSTPAHTRRSSSNAPALARPVPARARKRVGSRNRA